MNATTARWRQVAFVLIALGVTFYMTVSAHLLFALGIPYYAPGGNLVVKIHPGSYCILLGYFITLCSLGHPARVFKTQLRSEPAVAFFLAATLFLFFWALYRHGSLGAAFIIDTLIMAPICFLAVQLLELRRRETILLLMCCWVLVNATVGIGEAMVQTRLVPIRTAGLEDMGDTYFRASALMGHPLLNAQHTATVLPVVLLVPMWAGWRALSVAWLFLALLAFGGRASLILALIIYLAYFVCQAFSAVIRGRVAYTRLMGGLLATIVGSTLLVGVVVGSGLGERIFKSLAWDGSAAVRARVWSVFDYMTAEQMLFGASPPEVDVLYDQIGLEAPFEAIENFWLLIFIQYGAVGFIPFAGGLCLAVFALWRRVGGAVALSLLLLLATASTTNSLATKMPGLCLSMLLASASMHRFRKTAVAAPYAVPPGAGPGPAWPWSAHPSRIQGGAF